MLPYQSLQTGLLSWPLNPVSGVRYLGLGWTSMTGTGGLFTSMTGTGGLFSSYDRYWSVSFLLTGVPLLPGLTSQVTLTSDW